MEISVSAAFRFLGILVVSVCALAAFTSLLMVNGARLPNHFLRVAAP
jgi:hypothetical protein